MSPEDVVEKQLKYYNENDIDNFCSVFSDDVKVYRMPENKLSIDGIEEFKKRYKKSFEVSQSQAKIVNRMVIGNQVIDHEHVTTVLSDKVTSAVAIYEVRGCQISRVWFLSE